MGLRAAASGDRDGCVGGGGGGRVPTTTAEKPGHVEYRTHAHASQCKGDYDLAVAVHDAVCPREFLEHLPVDEALAVALRCVRVHGGGVRDVVGYEVLGGFYERGGAGVVGCEDVLVFVEWVADGDVAEGVDEGVLV